MNNQRGFSLLEIVIGLGIVAIGFLMVGYLLTTASALSTAENYRVGISSVRFNLVSMLTRDDAFRQTLTQSSFTGPSPYGFNDFQVLDGNGAVFYDPANPESGFRLGPDPGGGPATCLSYGVGNGASCPIRADISWQTICAGCTPVLIQVNVTFRTFINGYEQQGIANASRFNFSVIRPKTIP